MKPIEKGTGFSGLTPEEQKDLKNHIETGASLVRVMLENADLKSDNSRLMKTLSDIKRIQGNPPIQVARTIANNAYQGGFEGLTYAQSIRKEVLLWASGEIGKMADNTAQDNPQTGEPNDGSEDRSRGLQEASYWLRMKAEQNL